MTNQEKKGLAGKLEAKQVLAASTGAQLGSKPATTPTPKEQPMTVIPERKVRKPGRFTASQICSATKPEDVQKMLTELDKKKHE